MACLWGAWWHLPAAFLMTVAGIIGHELAHAVMMFPVAEKVRIHANNIWLAELHVESEIKNTEWRHKWADVAGFAPLIFATAIVGGLWYLGRLPSTSSVLGWGTWHALLWFGLLGGLSDYSRGASVQSPEDGESESMPGIVRAMSDGGQKFVKEEQRLLTALMVGLLAAAVGMLYGMVCVGTVATAGTALAWVAGMISLTAVGVLLKRSQQYDIQWGQEDL